ncbi:MAG TPA: DUF2950 domain-containing protein [Candidatus Binataceae bacterium]|nr:DUF2950 domain-containing protein [Candidatus Binataceae bacterium]
MLQGRDANRGKTIGRLTLKVILVDLFIGLVVGGFGISRSAFAQEAGQETFNSPAAAADALAAAAQKHDKQEMLAILGHSGQKLIYSGDQVADRANNDRFVAKYHQMHRFVATGKGRLFLYIGAENWPLAIPLQKNGAKWYFDTAYGEQEVLYRRIGSNELNVIKVCKEIVDGEREYYAELHDGDSVHQYAQKFRSTPGKQDGLYWEVTSGEESPLGPLVAEAASEGYKHHGPHAAGHPHPFHGYVYRLLTSQGAAAPGGARSYIVDGKMKGGFALVAYPIRYRDSGVMTFVVNQDGQIYQKDLGSRTAQIASEMVEYNPDKTWQPVDETENAKVSETQGSN